MPNDVRSDNLSKTVSEELSAEAKTSFGIPENNNPGKGDIPHPCSAENWQESLSAESRSSQVDSSGNNSANHIPVTIVITKIDKVSSSKKARNLKIIKDTLNLAVGDNYVMFSSVNKSGREEILDILEKYVIETI